MAQVISFPDKIHGAPNVAVTLSGTEWLAVAMKLAGRPLGASGLAELEEAEAKMLKQLGGAK